MAVVFFALLATLVRGYPSNVPRDGSAEDIFATSNLNLFADSTLVPSLTSEDYTSSSDNLEPDASIFTSDFLQDYPPVSQTLADFNEGHTQTLFGDYVADSDPPVGDFDSLVATTNYGSENSASVTISNCDSSALESGDFLAEWDPNEDSLFNMFDPSVSVAEADDDMGMFNLKGRAEPRYRGGTGGLGGGVYVPVQRFELDPNTSPETTRYGAYAADGTPISMMNCPNGSKRTCCKWDAIPPFSQCWSALQHTISAVCRLAKNQFCCGGVSEPGGPGINCQPIQWSKARDGRRQREPSSPQGPTSNPFQEIFPILQPLPDLTPKPDFCSPRRRA